MKQEIDRYESEQLDRLSSQFKENFYVKDNILYAKSDKHDEAYATLTEVYNAMMYSVMIPRESNKILLPGTQIDDKTGRIYFKRGDDSDVYQYMVGLTNGTKGPKESKASKIIGAIKAVFCGAKRATTKYAPVVTLAIVGTLATPTAQANEAQRTTPPSKTKTERPSRRLQNDKTPKMFQKYKTQKQVKDKRLANSGR